MMNVNLMKLELLYRKWILNLFLVKFEYGFLLKFEYGSWRLFGTVAVCSSILLSLFSNALVSTELELSLFNIEGTN